MRSHSDAGGTWYRWRRRRAAWRALPRQRRRDLWMLRAEPADRDEARTVLAYVAAERSSAGRTAWIAIGVVGWVVARGTLAIAGVTPQTWWLLEGVLWTLWWTVGGLALRRSRLDRLAAGARAHIEEPDGRA